MPGQMHARHVFAAAFPIRSIHTLTLVTLVTLVQVDLIFSEVDEVDRSNLACILGRNIGGTAPVHLPIPRERQLLASSKHLIALVDDPDKVLTLFEQHIKQQESSVLHVFDAVECP